MKMEKHVEHEKWSGIATFAAEAVVADTGGLEGAGQGEP